MGSADGWQLQQLAGKDQVRVGPDRADNGPRQVRVRPGDSLWVIAEQRLGPRATVVEIVGYWHRIYDRNTDVIGPDPDLILPGQLLELPPTG